MEPLTEALRLLRRQAELEIATRKPGGIRCRVPPRGHYSAVTNIGDRRSVEE